MARRQRDAQNWGSVGIGIITFATILAAATSAGIFAVAAELFSPDPSLYPENIQLLITILAIASLLSYVAVVAFGLVSLFRRTQPARRSAAARTAYAASVQTYTAVVAATITVLFPLLERITD